MKQPPEKFSVRKSAKSFQYGFAGLWTAFRGEHNMWIHLTAAVLAILFGWLCQLTKVEWILLLLCIGGVLSLEIINTALEKLCDLVHKDFHPLIRQIKDLAAAAVLVMAIVAFIIGCLLFIPHIIGWLG